MNNNSNESLQILMPVHNEGKSLEETILKIYEVVKTKINFSFIICEDGSNDDTVEILNRLKLKYPIILLTYPFKKGYSNAVIDGYSASLTSLSERLTELIQITYSFPKNDVFSSFVNLESFGYVSAFDEHTVPNSVSVQKIMSLNANRKAVVDFQSNYDY